MIDAEGKVLGRLAVQIADLLMGKSKPGYFPHKDEGDFVVCINASKVVVTGNKKTSKIYTRYSGYRGGLTKMNFERLHSAHPDRIISHAVHGMLPKNRLNACRLKRLKVYPDASHPHEAQKPVKLGA